MIRLFVEDQEVYLKKGSQISLTVKKIDLNNLASRYISYTNTFSAQKNKENEALFQLASFENSNSSTVYSKLNCRLLSNGLEILSGVCFVKLDVDFYKITVYDQDISYFDTIKDMKLNQLGYITNTGWLDANKDSLRTSASQIISAVVHYGSSTLANYNKLYHLPCFYYKDAINAILNQNGFIASGNILNDATLAKLVFTFPFEEFVYPKSNGEPYEFLVSKTATSQSASIAPGNGAVVVFDEDNGTTLCSNNIRTYQGSGKIFSKTTNKAKIPTVNAGVVTMRYNCNIFFSITSYGGAGAFKCNIMQNNTVLVSTSFNNVSHPSGSTYTATLATGDVNLLANDEIYVQFIGDTTSANIVLLNGNVTYFQSTFNDVVDLTLVKWNALLSETKCSDFLKDFFTRFGVVPKIVGNNIYLKTLNEIITDVSSALDWTSKRASEADINFDLSYGQSNYFLYQSNSDFKDKDYGSGVLTTANRSLPVRKDIYKSIFTNSYNYVIGSVSAAWVNIYDSTSTSIIDFKNEVGIRLLKLRDKKAAEPNIIFDAIARSDYKVGSFLDANEDNTFRFYMENYYALFGAALFNTKVVVRKYNLTEVDILGYDPHKMIFDNGSYYIVNKINNFVEDNLTEVELFKVG